MRNLNVTTTCEFSVRFFFVTKFYSNSLPFPLLVLERVPVIREITHINKSGIVQKVYLPKVLVVPKY